MEIDHLRTLISNLRLLPQDILIHKNIFSLIDLQILNKPPYTTQCPPLDIASYAIRNILNPTPNFHQIPDILDLLTVVEDYRQYASNKAAAALTFNNFYQRESNVLRLTSVDEHNLSKLVHNTTHREIYVRLILDLVTLDIYQLWTTTNSHLLPARLNDYFPSLNLPGSTTRIFHSTFSHTEKQELHATAITCVQFLKEAHAWELAREAEIGNDRDSSYDNDFTERFKSVVDTDALLAHIEFYLNKVQFYLHTLNTVFTHNPI